ncbi:MAG TPA: hypothetical protein VFJ02_13520, partial [Vicinamibacterales bacterium]|nr:hypothetical protein [Vicinamibacterales bacterium]
MRHIPLVGVLLVLVVGTTASMQTARSELENVAAVARLYGVIRYFYPSDAAASLDWNRFAVHATKEARAARSTKDLEAVLKTLVAPLGPGIVIGARLPAPPPKGATDPTLVAWRYFGAAIGRPAAAQGPYKAKRTNRPLIVPSTLDGFAGQMQAVPALNLRGRAIRLRGMVRADARDMTGSAALWLRVDRGGNQPGFFDNMADRPVRDRNWREYSIVGDVADDATSIAFGTGALGAVVADFDAIALESRLPGGAWTPVAIQDPGFEGVWIGGWMSAGNSKRAVVTRPSDQAPEGKQFLRVAAPPELVSTTELYAEGAPIAGASIDIDLGTGLKARVPLALSDADASATAANPALRGLQSALAALPEAPPSTDLDTRLADTVVAWNVFRHFYPYWKEAGVDWNARLVPLLDDARKAATRE